MTAARTHTTPSPSNLPLVFFSLGSCVCLCVCVCVCVCVFVCVKREPFPTPSLIRWGGKWERGVRCGLARWDRLLAPLPMKMAEQANAIPDYVPQRER